MPIFVTEDAYLCIQRCLSSSGKKGINFSKEITAIFPGINTILKKKSTDIFSGIMGCSRLGINKKIRTFVSVEK